MTPLIQLYHRPAAPVTAEIVQIARLLTEHWFTANVPEDIQRDLMFHDALCLYEDGQMQAFLVFTSLDGNLQITLMGTHPHCRGNGYGSLLMEHLFQHAASLGFEQVVAMTVPPDVKPAYQATLAFYRKHGFIVTRRYEELWENGALELIKRLSPS